MNSVLHPRWRYFLFLAGFTFLFAGAGSFPSFYVGDTNVYYLRAAAASGFGWLRADWIVQTHDPFPIFTLLVRTGYGLFGYGPSLYYLLSLGSIFLFLFVALELAKEVFHLSWEQDRTGLFLYAVFVLSVYSHALNQWTGNIVPHALELGGYRFWPQEFLPRNAAVFIFLSILFFLRKRRCIALLFLGLAASMHPTFILYAVLFAATYVLVTYYETRSLVLLLRMSALSILSVLPITVYTLFTLTRPTTASIMQNALAVLVHERLPHALDPSRWIAGEDTALLLMLLGLFVLRKTRLFPLLLLPFLAAAALSVLGVLTKSETLLLMMPWRISIVITTLCLLLAGAALITFVMRRFHRVLRRAPASLMLQLGVGSIVLLLFFAGVPHTYRVMTDASPAQSLHKREVLEFIRNTAASGDLYLVPPAGLSGPFTDFRLRTGVPIVVDFKNHPFRDRDLLAWRERLAAVVRLYDLEEDPCTALLSLQHQYGATHLLWNKTAIECPGATPVYANTRYRVYALADPQDR